MFTVYVVLLCANWPQLGCGSWFVWIWGVGDSSGQISGALCLFVEYVVGELLACLVVRQQTNARCCSLCLLPSSSSPTLLLTFCHTEGMSCHAVRAQANPNNNPRHHHDPQRSHLLSSHSTTNTTARTTVRPLPHVSPCIVTTTRLQTGCGGNNTRSVSRTSASTGATSTTAWAVFSVAGAAH